jgi:hypothetical protein
MKYKLTKINIPEKFCSKCGDWYLIEAEDGKTIQELAEPFYNMLVMLMDYNSIKQAADEWQRINNPS